MPPALALVKQGPTAPPPITQAILKSCRPSSLPSFSRSARTVLHSRTVSGPLLLDPRVTRHWIHSLHRMVLGSSLPATKASHYSTITKPLATRAPRPPKPRLHKGNLDKVAREGKSRTGVTSRDFTKTKALGSGQTTGRASRQGCPTTQYAPIFTRQTPSRASRSQPWLLGSPRKQAPLKPTSNYYTRDDPEELQHLGGRHFDPFHKSLRVGRVQRRAEFQEALADPARSMEGTLASRKFWAIDALPLTNQDQTKLMRSGARLDQTVSPIMSLEESGAALENTAGESGFDQSADRTTDGTPVDSFSNQRQRTPLAALMNRIQDHSAPSMTRQKLEYDLYNIGQIGLSNLGLKPEFVRASANQADVISSGLDTFLSKALSPNMGLAERVLHLLHRLDMLQLVERPQLYKLQAIVADRPAGTLVDPTAMQALTKALQRRTASSIDAEEWRIQTSRFRLQLALARESGVDLSEQGYARFMKLCLKANQYHELELAFHHLLDTDKTPTEEMYGDYIKALTRQGRMEHAHLVFNGMQRKGVTPSMITYRVLLDGYGRHMDLDKMGSVLKSLQADGRSPTIEIYTSLMSNYIRGGEISKADRVYQQLLNRKDLVMDGQSKNVAINLLSHMHDRGTLTPKYFKEVMEEASTPTGESDGSKERRNAVVAVNLRMAKQADMMNTPRLVDFYRKLGRQGLEPNTTTFNIFLDSMGKTGGLDEGLKVLEHMKSVKACQPDVVTYTTLIRSAIQQGTADLGWSLYDDMNQCMVMPNLRTYVSLFELVALDPRNKMGQALVREHSIKGRHSIRFPVKKWLEEQLGLNFAAELYNQLVNQGLTPNEHVFASLLDLTVRGGHMKLAQHVYQEMVAKKVEPNTAIMTILIKGFAVQKDFESGWKVWRAMLEGDIARNTTTYYHLIRLCERSLPNPMVMAEMLDGPAAGLEGTALEKFRRRQEQKAKEQLRILKRKARRNGLKMEEVPTLELENTSRIPLTIWTEIRNQMKADRVDWSRVQQFRRKDVDRAIWDPIPKNVGPVIKAGVVDYDVMNSQAEFGSLQSLPPYAKDPLDKEHVGQATAQSESASSGPWIMEVTTGGGDGFTQTRDTPKSLKLKWNSDTREPVVKVDWDRRPFVPLPLTVQKYAYKKKNKKSSTERVDKH